MDLKWCLLGLVSSAVCVSCQPSHSTKIGVDQEALASAFARPDVRFSRVRVTCRIVTGEKIETLPAVVIRRGRSGSASLTSEEQYPTQFDFPQIGEQKKGETFPITPAKPTAFEAGKFGWTLELGVEARESFIMLQGTLTERRLGYRVRSTGLPFQPITTQASDALGRDVAVTLTDNHADRPAVISKSFPILIAAQPAGSPYRVYLDENHQSYAEIGCEVVD